MQTNYALELEKDRRVNKAQLHQEFLDLPDTFIKWAKRHNEALKLQKSKKKELEIIAANIKKRIRKKWFDDNKDKKKTDKDAKPTAQELDDILFTEPEYNVVWEELLELEDQVNTFSMCKDMINLKRSSLKYAWEMLKEGYFKIMSVEPEGVLDSSQQGKKLKIKTETSMGVPVNQASILTSTGYKLVKINE